MASAAAHVAGFNTLEIAEQIQKTTYSYGFTGPSNSPASQFLASTGRI